MKNKNQLLKIALSGLLVSGVAAIGNSALAAKDMEKCFGVAKAGKNDCQTSNSSCAGTAKADRLPDAWISVPAGTCAKIAGGTTKS